MRARNEPDEDKSFAAKGRSFAPQFYRVSPPRGAPLLTIPLALLNSSAMMLQRRSWFLRRNGIYRKREQLPSGKNKDRIIIFRSQAIRKQPEPCLSRLALALRLLFCCAPFTSSIQAHWIKQWRSHSGSFVADRPSVVQTCSHWHPFTGRIRNERLSSLRGVKS